ncbi:PREDICTED: S phase cyclin A-associated protein in the endoplasmic reticulum-like [Priapulus caudatus]|uniref:S phase cyclin A-associated protein in the endoplasmic reticulum-like n=1 Tax=Priapulus caudatus TaxID=37621 RepID=A0ABM1ELI8_PRICU|nr:PREDICTED: S phase cyclin A-associated protein in the endoplasmic reticulum-like [Priapulus caudatus]
MPTTSCAAGHGKQTMPVEGTTSQGKQPASTAAQATPKMGGEAEAKKARGPTVVTSGVRVGGSWADRVKALPHATAIVKPQPVATTEVLEDDEGWETVQRSKPRPKPTNGSGKARPLSAGATPASVTAATKPSGRAAEKSQSHTRGTRSRAAAASPLQRAPPARRPAWQLNRPSPAVSLPTLYAAKARPDTLDLPGGAMSEAHNVSHHQEALPKASSVPALATNESSSRLASSESSAASVQSQDAVAVATEDQVEQGTIASTRDGDNYSLEMNMLLDARDSVDLRLEDFDLDLDPEREQALQTVIQQEESLTKELEQEERKEIVVDTEPETEEADDIDEDEEEEGVLMQSRVESTEPSQDWNTIVTQYESRVEEHMSWGDIVEASESRLPGRALQIHEKLSSPSRKRSLTESIRRHKEKQAKALELREKLMEDKALHLKELSRKVEEVRAVKEDLLSQRRLAMEDKLQRAEEKRLQQLQMKVSKCKEEDAKVIHIDPRRCGGQ